MDRIRGGTISAPSYPYGDHLQRVLAQPSLAAQLLTATAYELTRYMPQQPLTATGWSAACARAARGALANYPETIANAAIGRAFAVMPQMRNGDTQGEYSLRLRVAARSV